MLMMDASRFLSRFAERQRHSLVECDTFRSFNFLSYSSLAITIPVPESRLESICCNEGGSTCSRVISFASSLGRTIIHPDLRFECTLQVLSTALIDGIQSKDSSNFLFLSTSLTALRDQWLEKQAVIVLVCPARFLFLLSV
nr:uncharacterized protein LOC112272827 [Physcomitrium patens]|eukprot:XP_024356738.1 uncharacterized protein LOC112272827 [Physcomitrella patens]